MVMILHAFVGNFSRLLTKMAADEVGMLLGIPGEMEKLSETVRDIQCVLSDAEQKQTNSSAIKRWLLQLKDVMYDADDLMDICRIKAEDRRGRYDFLSSSKVSCGISFLSCFHNPLFAHEIGKRIKDLNSRLDEISKKKSDLGLVELQDVVRPFNTRHEYSDISRQTDPSVALADLVGGKIEEDADLLVKWLTLEEMSGKENVSAVAIAGMPGIGKTTLAKRVFNDPRIQEEFHLKFWVCVSKDLKGVELLKCIIREAGGNHGAAEERSELVSMLERLVRGKKFILVLDDVWPESQNVWDELLRVPMNGGAHGSRLLVTTRDDRVARFMHATASHQVEKLLEKDDWCLLIKQVSLDETESEILKDIGLELVKKCDGVPLAIKAIGGVLRMKGKNRADWQKIIKSTLWSLADLSSDFPHAFYLSYEDLPSHLKQCFVICSLYPEDTVFERSELVYLWLAEGFLCDDGALSFLELGIEYYKELIMRNLLEVSGGYYDQICCKMHDLWRSFAGYLGKGDNFIMREGELCSRSEPLLKLRRLSIEGTVVDLDFLNKEKYLRTLLLVNNPMGEFLSNALVSFSHLRIVDLYKSNISSLPDSFCGLVHLRYLDLTGSLLKALPNSIGKLRNLVFLGLGGCLWLSDFPSSIVNLLELRFLSFHNTTIEVFPVGLRKLEKLVELHGFKPDTNNSKGLSSLEDIGNLSQLSKLILCSLEKASDITVAKEANLKEKGQLKTLILSYTPNQGREDPTTFEEKKVAQDVLNALSPPPSLEILQIIGYFGLQLPNWLHVGINLSNFKFLRFLELTECECISQLPPVGQLPNLDLLRIKGAISVISIGQEFLLDDSNGRTRKEVSHSSILPFSLLNELDFHRMSCWEEWLWEEKQLAMPKLKKLFIKNCPELSSLPKGLLHHATSLEVLQIDAAEQIKSVQDLQSVKQIHVANNPSLERISNLPNLSFILISNCPNLEILEHLKPFHRMELWDIQIETLPKYLIMAMPEKLTVWCSKRLLLKIISLEAGSSEWQKFEHIPVVKIYSHDESFYATYQKEPFSFTTNIPGKSRAVAQ